jgi:hypothetical protein
MDTSTTVSPRNVEDITVQVFFMKLQDIKKEFIPVALSSTDNLIQAWNDYSQINETSSVSRTPKGRNIKLKMLMEAVNNMLQMLKPSAKQRLLRH